MIIAMLFILWKTLFSLSFVAVAADLEDLEARVEDLEEVVHSLEESLVKDYGLVKRCRLPQVENGLVVCRFKGVLIEINSKYLKYIFRFEAWSKL